MERRERSRICADLVNDVNLALLFLAIALVEGSQAQIVDFGFDFGLGRVGDAVAQLLDKQFHEFFAGALQSLAKRFRTEVFSAALGELLGQVLDGSLRVSDPKVEDSGVAIFGILGFVRIESGEDPFDNRLAPDPVVLGVGNGRIGEFAGGERLKFSTSEVIDDQAVKDGAQVVSEASLRVVGPGEFMVQELDPELLKDFVGEIRIAEFQAEVAFHGIVIATDQMAHGFPTFRAFLVGRSDEVPVGRQLRQSLWDRITGHHGSVVLPDQEAATLRSDLAARKRSELHPRRESSREQGLKDRR